VHIGPFLTVAPNTGKRGGSSLKNILSLFYQHEQKQALVSGSKMPLKGIKVSTWLWLAICPLVALITVVETPTVSLTGPQNESSGVEIFQYQLGEKEFPKLVDCLWPDKF